MRRFFVERLYCDISGDPMLMIVDSVPHSQNRLGRNYVLMNTEMIGTAFSDLCLGVSD
jgi:hypothetical protein